MPSQTVIMKLPGMKAHFVVRLWSRIRQAQRLAGSRRLKPSYGSPRVALHLTP